MFSRCKNKHFSASVQEICRFSAESDGVLGKNAPVVENMQRINTAPL